MVSVAIAVFGGSFQYGYNISVVNAPAKIIQEYFFEGQPNPCAVNNTSKLEEKSANSTPATELTTNNLEEISCEIVLTPSELLVWSVTVSIYTVGGMVGAFSTGTLVGIFGRKSGLLVMNALSITGAIMMACSKPANTIVLLIVPRFLLGVYAGLATGVVPMYIGEISPKKYRGAVMALNQLLITIGLLTGQVLGLEEILGTPEFWNILLAFTCVPSLVELSILPFCPESPRCLLIDKKDEDAAREALAKLRGTSAIDQEIEEMKVEARSDTAESQMSLLEILRDRSIRWQIYTVCVIQIGQPLTGINAVFFYLNTILETAQVDSEIRNYISVGVGVYNVVLTVISVAIIERAGRRPLLLYGWAVATGSHILLTISLSLLTVSPAMQYVSIVSVFIFITGFAIGPGPIVWILTAEMFRQSARPAALSLGCGLNWFFNVLVALVFPFLQRFMNQFVFILFLIVSALVTVYIGFVVPETKNQTFQEISMKFAGRNGVHEDEKEKCQMEPLRST